METQTGIRVRAFEEWEEKSKKILIMINEPLYKKTVDILYQAYFNDTLRHRDCFSCAVGNIVSANRGENADQYSFRVKSMPFMIEDKYPTWSAVFCTDIDRIKGELIQSLSPECLEDDNVKDDIDITGYSWVNLAKIEWAFESANNGKSIEDYIFNGLVAVLGVLKQIHQVTDEDLITTNHKRFSDHYSTLVK